MNRSSATAERQAFKVGDKVQTYWDDGWHGTTLYGEVVQAGPVAATVLWESGFRNRIRHADPRGVKHRKDD